MTRKKTGGRKKGTPNKTTSEVMQYARQYTEDAITALVNVLKSDESPPQAKVSAANALLDRAYGKPSQHVKNEAVEPTPIDSIDFESLTDEQLKTITKLPTKSTVNPEGKAATS